MSICLSWSWTDPIASRTTNWHGAYCHLPRWIWTTINWFSPVASILGHWPIKWPYQAMTATRLKCTLKKYWVAEVCPVVMNIFFVVVLTVNVINLKWDQMFFIKPCITSSLLNVIPKNMEDTKGELVDLLAWLTIFWPAENTSQSPNW